MPMHAGREPRSGRDCSSFNNTYITKSIESTMRTSVMGELSQGYSGTMGLTILVFKMVECALAQRLISQHPSVLSRGHATRPRG
jgi:hypothetical protein